jgi:hypothetical protein
MPLEIGALGGSVLDERNILWDKWGHAKAAIENQRK